MSLPRLISTLLYQNARLVRSQQFSRFLSVGDPYLIAERYKQWDLDELIFLNISPYEASVNSHSNFDDFCDVIRKNSDNCFTPLSAGGGITCLEDMLKLLKAGADRIVLNTICFSRPDLISEASLRFGSQAIIVSVDVKQVDGKYEVFSHGGRKRENVDLKDWIKKIQDLGAGEIFLNNIDRDGLSMGYDLDLIAQVAAQVGVPLTVCGGAGRYEDFSDAILKGGASSAAGGSLFLFRELSYFDAKTQMEKDGVPVRAGHLGRDYRALRERENDNASRLGAEQEKIWQDLGAQEFDL